MAEDGVGVEVETKPVGFWEAFWFWVRLGFINFGGPAGQIAIMHRELVEKKRWVSEGQYLRTLNFCMLLPGPELAEISEIMHDADLMDEKYGRPESDGLDAIIRGMQLVLPDDQTLTGYTDAAFDGLYAYLSREVL